MGKRLSFTVDLSEVGCGCNAALYMVSMSYSYEVPGGQWAWGVFYVYVSMYDIMYIYIYKCIFGKTGCF